MSQTLRFELEQIIEDEDASRVRSMYLSHFRAGRRWAGGGFTFCDGFEPPFSDYEMAPVRVVGGGCELPRADDAEGWRRVGVDVRGFLDTLAELALKFDYCFVIDLDDETIGDVDANGIGAHVLAHLDDLWRERTGTPLPVGGGTD